MKKAILIVIGVFASLFFLLFAVAMCSEDGKPKEVKPVIPYEQLTHLEKEKEIKSFMDGKLYDTSSFRLNQTLVKGLKSYVKYPETLEVYYFDEWRSIDKFYGVSPLKYIIDDVDKGIVTLFVEFRSENKLGMKVRNEMKFTFKFNQDKIIDVIDVKVE